MATRLNSAMARLGRERAVDHFAMAAIQTSASLLSRQMANFEVQSELNFAGELSCVATQTRARPPMESQEI